MKELDFNPYKTGKEFRNNYKLHDLAENHGKNLLIQWGFSFSEFGGDKRFEKVWEKGNDKPDLVISYKGRRALIDWKGKHKPTWLINKRAYQAYNNWMEKLNIPVFVAFFVFNDSNVLSEIKFACIGKHSFIESKNKEWDKNSTIEFEIDLPEFTKLNLVNFILNNNLSNNKLNK
jgi:hypothetical protein